MVIRCPLDWKYRNRYAIVFHLFSNFGLWNMEYVWNVGLGSLMFKDFLTLLDSLVCWWRYCCYKWRNYRTGPSCKNSKCSGRWNFFFSTIATLHDASCCIQCCYLCLSVSSVELWTGMHFNVERVLCGMLVMAEDQSLRVFSNGCVEWV